MLKCDSDINFRLTQVTRKFSEPSFIILGMNMNMTITAWFNSKKLNNNYYKKVIREGDVFYATIYHFYLH